MEKNAFKELEEDILLNRQDQLDTVKSNLMHTHELLQTLGDVLDLYFPKAMEVMLNLSERPGTKEEDHNPTT